MCTYDISKWVKMASQQILLLSRCCSKYLNIGIKSLVILSVSPFKEAAQRKYSWLPKRTDHSWTLGI
jgi:hypothetical protein